MGSSKWRVRALTYEALIVSRNVAANSGQWRLGAEPQPTGLRVVFGSTTPRPTILAPVVRSNALYRLSPQIAWNTKTLG
jgi:hypothetical protein